MNQHPVEICDPSWIAAAAAFVFIGGMLVASPAVMLAGGAILAVSLIVSGVSSVRRRLQVRLQPAVRAYRRR
jgi:hypothetical protein